MKKALVAVGSMLVGLVACGGEPGEEADELQTGDVETGEAEQALSELYCAGHPDVQLTAGTNGGCNFGILWPNCKSLSGPSYGSAGCPEQYTVQVNNAYDQRWAWVVEWGDEPLTFGNCSTSWLDLTAYVKSYGGTGGPHTDVYGYTRLHGNWNGTACIFNYAPGYSSIPVFDGNETTWAVAAAARATTCSIYGGCSLKKVRTGTTTFN